MAWLGGELPKDQQDAATPFAPRCVKDVLEEELFASRRDLGPQEPCGQEHIDGRRC
jgi:hypothetical protein